MAKPNIRALKNIDLDGYNVVTAVGDLSDYREVTQMIVFFLAGLMIMAIIANSGLSDGSVLLQINHYLPIAAFTFVICIIGMIFYLRSRARSSELKIISVDENGFELGRKKQEHDRAIAVPWWEVLATEAVSEGKNNYTIYIATRSKDLYKLKWQNAFAWTDAEPFFLKLKTYAPEAYLNIAAGDIQVSNDDTRYTNLWLQYFSTPDSRKRKQLLSPGDRINENRFEVVERIGGGGQGIAYLARADTSDCIIAERLGRYSDNLVVLKEYVLPVHRGAVLCDEKETLLNREAEILSRIDHPSIVRMIDCFVEDYRGYLVLEYVAGETLKHWIEKNGKLDQISAVNIGLAVCDILAYLHSMYPPVIHRDVTPDNLILSRDGSIKLVDFTVAHQFESQRAATVVGKQAYMPPEQFRGQPSPQSDIYALGCTLFFVLTATDPEPMRSSRPSDSDSSVSARLSAIIEKATAFDAADRYHKVTDMVADLHNFRIATQQTQRS